MIALSHEPDAAASQSQAAPTLNTIIFWASQSAMHQGLVQAMRAYLTEYEVLLVDRLPDKGIEIGQVGFVLLDLGPDVTSARAVAACRERFPNTGLGLVMRGADREFAGCDALFERGEIQGVLPLELKLDIWLAALSLLLKGGEYYPPILSRRGQRPRQLPRWENGIAARHGIEDRRRPDPAIAIANLTPRERQVLELLSEGYQNKLIADRMALSEHTVKVHVHNLITKMRVTNRTQAAAAFRSGRLAPTLPLQERRLDSSARLEGRY